MLVERRGALVRVRRDDGEWEVVSSHLQPFESMMESVADPQRAAEVHSDCLDQYAVGRYRGNDGFRLGKRLWCYEQARMRIFRPAADSRECQLPMASSLNPPPCRSCSYTTLRFDPSCTRGVRRLRQRPYLVTGRLSSVRQLAGSGLDSGPTT
jgi:hypothetical protein